KSRLLLRLAATLDGAFPAGGGALDVSQLRAPGLVAPAVAAALGAPFRCDEFRQPTLIDWLGGRRTWLLLDNCETRIVECAELIGGLVRAYPELNVLVTSREPLGIDGETIWRVSP